VVVGLLAGSTSMTAQRGPAPGMTHLSREVMELACAPTITYEPLSPSMLITGGQDSFTRHSFGPGDLITINAGTANGIEVGQEFYVRRVQPGRMTTISRSNPATIRTTGWVKVYAVDPRMSLVTVSHACDTLNIGDYLEPFVLPTVPVADPNPAKPQRDNYAHIMLGSDRRTSFGRGDFFVMDWGGDHNVAVGDRVVVYRDKRRMEEANRAKEDALPADIVFPEFLYELGEALVVEVNPQTSTLQVTLSRDAIMSGDYVALRK